MPQPTPRKQANKQKRSRDREFFVRSSSRITSPTNPTQSRCSDDGLLRSPLGYYKIEHLSCFCSTVAVTTTLLLSACAALILAASPPADSRFVRSFVCLVCLVCADIRIAQATRLASQ